MQKQVKIKLSLEEYKKCLDKTKKEVLKSIEALAKKILERRFK